MDKMLLTWVSTIAIYTISPTKLIENIHGQNKILIQQRRNIRKIDILWWYTYYIRDYN